MYTVNAVDMNKNVYFGLEVNQDNNSLDPNIHKMFLFMRDNESFPPVISVEELVFILSHADENKAVSDILNVDIKKKLKISSPRGVGNRGIVIDFVTGEPCVSFRISLKVDFEFENEEDYLQWTLSQ